MVLLTMSHTYVTPSVFWWCSGRFRLWSAAASELEQIGGIGDEQQISQQRTLVPVGTSSADS